MKRAYLNLVLLGVVLALTATVYFTRKKEEKGVPLTALSADAVKTIAIEHPGDPAIRIEKRGSQWWLTAPVSALCDPFEVASIINIASQTAQRKLKLSEVKPAELKLDPPQFTLTLNDQKLLFGDAEPLEYRRYVQHGEDVALIDDPPATTLDADYSDLVAKELLPTGAQLQAISVPGLSLQLNADGKTWTATPAMPNSSADDTARLVDAWRSARAMWNARMPGEETIKDQGKPQPIALTLKDGQHIDLLLIAREPQLIIDRPDLKVRYTLSKADGEKLLQLTPSAKPATASALPEPKK